MAKCVTKKRKNIKEKKKFNSLRTILGYAQHRGSFPFSPLPRNTAVCVPFGFFVSVIILLVLYPLLLI